MRKIWGYLLLLITGISILGGVWWMLQPKEYEYIAQVGSAGGYTMLPDFNHNYLTDQQGRIILPFTTGGPVSKGWPGSDQATNVGEVQVLPYKITVRWYSIAEDQFWEGEALFDQKVLEHYAQLLGDDLTSLIVNYAPGGLVTVWMSGGGNIYLITQFKAHKIDNVDWDDFITPLFGKFKESRERYLKYQLTGTKGKTRYCNLTKEIQQEIREHRVPDAEPWLRLMHKYSWVLKTNNLYELKRYSAVYANGEQYDTLQINNQTEPRAVPFVIITDIEDIKTHQPIRLVYT
ncbi:DUF2931 family protein, partial [Commensalibacter oyaizuii]